MRQESGFNQEWMIEEAGERKEITLPHAPFDLPYDYCDETSYQRPYRYFKTFEVSKAQLGREMILRFDGVMADARVFLNGTQIAAHSDGYTPFEARLTDALVAGTNEIEVQLSGEENPTIPPFGGTIDYLCYAGIYRDVWLIEADPLRIASVKIETPGLEAGEPQVRVKVRLANPQGLQIQGDMTLSLHDPEGRLVSERHLVMTGEEGEVTLDDPGDVMLWDIDHPNLYRLVLTLDANGSVDLRSELFGFRTAEFRADGFYLNGQPLKLIGLNRHQAFPHIGYALGRAAQEKDAEILKHELGCTIVRTSHYPQSPWFLDHCDRIGLLVLEEIPGWQHLGDAAWQDRSVDNVRAMIERDWNHPSIILWGVRINESADHHAFYTRTNAMARRTDPTRQTGGIRCIPNSELLEDVYTMNDFILGAETVPGSNRGKVPLQDQRMVTGRSDHVPYLVTEYNGHMYPTTIEDGEERQTEHVLKHLEVLEAAYGDPHIAGCIGWCFVDYNTHKDFGAGDRICHHGVMNMCRQPKFAAFAYSSQMAPDRRVVMEPVSHWTMGNRATGGVLPLVVLTNCDRVELRSGDKHMVGLPARDRFPSLPHPPVIFEGEIEAANGFDLWGTAFADVEFVGYLEGEVVARRVMSCAPLPTTLEAVADKHSLVADGEDCTRISVRALDQTGNHLPYLQGWIDIAIEGDVHLVGPQRVVFRGGYAAFWIRSGAKAGLSRVLVSSNRFASVALDFELTAAD